MDMEKDSLSTLVQSGLSQRKIAEKLSCSQANVKYWLKKYDLLTLKNSKICKKCGKDTNKKNSSSRGHGVYCFTVCKSCHNQQRIERFRRKKSNALAIKGGKCQRPGCGYDKCQDALEFHHIEPEQKDPHWKNMRSWSLEKTKKELEKCLLLCSNCHREKHANIW
jgi:predicted transcriptional regulator